MSGYPKTKGEWWGLVRMYWTDLSNIFHRFIPHMFDAAYRAYLDDDPILADYLQQAWSNAPDVPAIHCIPGWRVLCDLCSDSYLLYEPEVGVKVGVKNLAEGVQKACNS